MKWNTTLYQNKHDFVAEYGKALLEHIADDKTQAILDVGCGTGELTHELSQKANTVIGIDYSESMIQMAKEKHPKIEFHVMDACNLTWQNHFDVVFSNAVFHWIEDQSKLLGSIYRALKYDGKLICEFGAHGCVDKIRTTFQRVLKTYGHSDFLRFYFPKTQEYSKLLNQVGFKIEMITDFDRPTVLKDGKFGLRNWLKQFYSADLSNFNESQQNDIFEKIEDSLYSDLWDGKQWIADYRRIRVVALR